MNLSLETVLRCLDLLPIVRENQGIRLQDLAERTGIPAKIISDQLIPALMLCGSPPYMPHDYVNIWLDGDAVYVSFADQFRRPVTLLPIEITALHLALSTLRLPNDHLPEIKDRVQELRQKIERALPQDLRVFLDDPDRISVDDRRDASSPHLLPLKTAAEKHRKVRIDYLSRGETVTKSRVIHPYGLVTRDGVTYIVAYDTVRNHEVSFRLDRVLGVEVSNESFTPDPSFSLEQRAREGLFHRPGVNEKELRVRLRGRAAVIVAETLDQRQWRRENHDTVVLTLPTSRPRAAIRWVLRFGADAVVEGPEDLRQMAIDELRALRAAYP
ncbi:MAG: WYL domain-containing protein [Planctomycetes bacterium]|nr:WYL domain-containing protein [Planctomycetota bacterium]